VSAPCQDKAEPVFIWDGEPSMTLDRLYNEVIADLLDLNAMDGKIIEDVDYIETIFKEVVLNSYECDDPQVMPAFVAAAVEKFRLKWAGCHG
jgi:hypothetical protein